MADCAYLYEVTYGNGTFLVVGQNGDIIQSAFME